MTRKEMLETYKYMFPENFKFEYNTGWDIIVEIALIQLAYIDTQKLIRIFQIKEKFGSLRINLNLYLLKNKLSEEEFDKIYEHIFKIENQAQHTSLNICENCGNTNTAKLRIDLFWHQTLCDECNKIESDANDFNNESLLCSGLLNPNEV